MIERAAVCCPGPSLPRTWKGQYGDYDLIHAVNRAMLVIKHADWLSAGDPIVLAKLLDGNRPIIGVITMADTATKHRDEETWSHLRFDTWEELDLYHAHKARGRPMAWSVQAALIHACHLGAKEIDLYGCDGRLSGTEIDCTGYPGEDRTLERWKREELDLALTEQILAERGATINHIKETSWNMTH